MQNNAKIHVKIVDFHMKTGYTIIRTFKEV